VIIGIPQEIKEHEYRVAAVPGMAEALTKAGHTVLVEAGAGRSAAITDQDYEAAGAEIVPDAKTVFARADMIIKVKEPLPQEYGLIKRDQIVFTYFHFAASEGLTRAMVDTGAVCIAYETIEEPDGSLPLLMPMSEVAGRMAVQEGAKYLERPTEGRGILLGGVPGVAPANVAVIGGGICGANAARMAAGLGARVVVLDVNLNRLRYLSDVMPPNVVTLMSDSDNLRNVLKDADLVVGAVLRTGAKTPVLITRDMLKLMKPGAVIVDVAIDQGGVAETSRATTHTNPVYVEEGVVHYCVANMPGAVPRTSTYALTNATSRFAQQIANKGWRKALAENDDLRKGLNIAEGKVVQPDVAELFGYPTTCASEFLA
jgi:alanine dehydrogenase